MSNKIEGLNQYIPFEKKEFRPHQEKAINDIIESIEDGNKFTILNANVGAGKSLLGYVVAKYYNDMFNEDTYMTTGTKLLQNQYLNDFTDVKTIKGRMNFPCGAEPMVDCANGMCQTHSNHKCIFKPALRETEWTFEDAPLPIEPIEIDGQTVFYGDELFDKEITKNMCPYWKQKINGIMSPITMLNYDYLISDNRFVNHLPYRHLLIADESHSIEKVLMRQLEETFSVNVIKKEIDYNFRESNGIDDWATQLYTISDLYKDTAKQTVDAKKKKKFNDKRIRFYELASLLEDRPSNWVFVKEKKTGYTYFSFKPIMVSQYTDLVFNLTNHVVLMTGTILKQDIFAKDLGIRDFSYIEVPSIIPPKNRPIVKMYAGPMSRASIESTMPQMIENIKEIASNHLGEKGLINTYTYSIANRLKNEFKNDERFLFHEKHDKEEVFESFKNSDDDRILVSPVAYEGIDLPYDQGRFHIIMKDPFPNLGDIQLKSRDMIDYGYIFRERCLVLSQAYGRCNRASDDFSVTYLLDSRLESLLGPATLVTGYFLEGLDCLNYTKQVRLMDDAYDKLTKDNKRKDHEFDRKVERALLEDIENGYDTLGKLHGTYKKFPSNAYTYIIPAFDRLLKNKAIEYI